MNSAEERRTSIFCYSNIGVEMFVIFLLSLASFFPNGMELQPVTLRLVKRLNQGSSSSTYSVQGVTKSENKIYVLCRYPSSVRVFEDGSPFRLLNEFRLPQIGWPRDMAYDVRSNCIYITDVSNNCLWKVTVTTGNQTLAAKWLRNVTIPHLMSLSSDGYLLVPRRGSYFIYKSNFIDIYNASDGRLVRNLRLPSDIKAPLLAVKTHTRREYLITHSLQEDYYNGDGPWVISRVSSDGESVISRSNPVGGGEQLYWPFTSADLNDDRLFVADYWHDRVVLFNSCNLDFRQVLLMNTRNQIQRPWRVFYDRNKKQLIVGQDSNTYNNTNDGGAVDIYAIENDCIVTEL